MQGIYQVAFLKVHALLEDSGWRLAKEGEEEDEAEGPSLEDLPRLGYMQ